jgi:hypothetical protein
MRVFGLIEKLVISILSRSRRGLRASKDVVKELFFL